MAAPNSQITVFPERLYSLRVLLVESKQSALKHDAYMLSKNLYRVTSTRKASIALSLIRTGKIFDCVLVDAEKLDMNMVHFLPQIVKHQPYLPIIVMAWSDILVRIVKGTLANEAIWFLQKPCEVGRICNILQQLCSKIKPLTEKQGHNSVQRVDTLVLPSAIHNSASINNNISSSNGTHRGIKIMSREYGTMSTPVNYIDISSDDDDELTIKENVLTGRAKNIDKGKKPMELKRKNDQRFENDINCKNKIKIKSEIPWTTALNGKFMETSKTLHEKDAYRKEIPILKQKKLLGFSHDHVARNLQIFQERKNNINKSNVVAPIQIGNNFQVASYACNRFGLSTPSDNGATITQCNNSIGASYTFDYIKAKVEGASPKPLSHQITTTLNFSSGSQENGLNFGDLFQPHIGTPEESLVSLVKDVDNFSNYFDNGNYGGFIVSETLAPLDRFGLRVPMVTTTGSVASSSNQAYLEDLTLPEFPSSDLGGVSPLQDFEETVENLFDDEDYTNISFPNSDSVTFGNASDDNSFPSIPGEENNSIVPFDGSEGRVIDDDWFLGMIHLE